MSDQRPELDEWLRQAFCAALERRTELLRDMCGTLDVGELVELLGGLRTLAEVLRPEIKLRAKMLEASADELASGDDDKRRGTDRQVV